MNLFETVKSAVTVKQAAEYYGYKVNRSDMICCPFHDDRHPSMKLNKDYFYCFGCGATGDVIDFVARLFGLSSYEAAKKLAYDFGINPDNPPVAMALKKPYPLARVFRNDEMYCQRVLCDYLHLLERWKIEYAPQSPEDNLDDRFVEAGQMLEYVEYLLDVLMFAELEQRVKTVDMLLKAATIAELEQRLKRLEKEVQHHGEERAIA
ncbi:CHC2 zinc finger domain-containing protein [Phascolarctobacterium faecium]|jgi:DNA primase (bacterial type)|uniref:CHC2 zinc finger domain-containing protein n=1 Tax=Phascolarctobacterium faecium TaxID=33025 RepID=UPI00399C1DE4